MGIDETDRDESERWEPETVDDLDWVFRKLRDASDRVDELAKQRDAWLAEVEQRQRDINDWFDAEARRHRETMGRMEAFLHAYAVKHRTDDVKSWRTPAGFLRTSRRDPYPQVVDDGVLVGWVRSVGRDDVVEVKERVPASALPKLGLRVADGPDGPVAVDESGVVVPGVAVVVPDVTVSW